jgi:D-3-phosphoglycerate dehydrogenase / 2-oxoglutarate reductase
LLRESDIVSLHVPGGAETKEMINKDFLDLMKPSSVLINTTRGSVANDAAILAKLEACPDFWYGSDVFNGEPSAKEAEWKSDLSTHPRVYGTHHCGASTKQAEEAIGEEALRVIKKYAHCGEIDLFNTVNRAKKDSSMQTMSVRHLDQVGVLLHVMKVFAEHNLCVQEMQNIVFAHREASVANITFTGEGFSNDK